LKPLTPAPEAVFTIAPPPCLSISGISYFMHRNTPPRLIRMLRSHSSSVISEVAVIGFSTPVKGKVEPPEGFERLVQSSLHVLSPTHIASRDKGPRTEFLRPVSWLPCSETSATGTLAPSRANASAVARPMPLAAPVTNATLSVEDAFLFIVVAVCVVGYLTSSMVASTAPDAFRASTSPSILPRMISPSE